MSGQGYAFQSLGVLTQAPGGGFQSPAYYELAAFELANGMGVGDVNGDGRNDVVLSHGGNGPSAQMAVFLLKAEHGSGYVPPGCADWPGDVGQIHPSIGRNA